MSRTGMPVGKQCDEATKVEFLLNKDEANRCSVFFFREEASSGSNAVFQQNQ